MIKETVTMSHKELDRLHIIQESLNRHITQEQAAARIGISIRQVKRLVQRYRNEGPSGLVSRRRGKRPNNSFSTEFRATVISLLKGRYADFGPTLACEKLREIHGLCLSIETLRKGMVEEAYGANVVVSLPEFISAGCGAHPTVNSSRLMARLMTGLKVGAPNAH